MAAPVPQKLRADAARRDIYARHSLPEDTPLDQAIASLDDRAASEGLTRHGAWANRGQRAQAQYDYATAGRTQPEMTPGPFGLPTAESMEAQRRYMRGTEERMGKARYLMDPHTAKHHQRYGRDQNFLAALLHAQNEMAPDYTPPSSVYYGQNPSGPAPDYPRLEGALALWDRSHAPLYRDGTFTGNTHDNNTISHAVADLFANPDTLTGQYMQGSEVGPVGNAGRYATSGEMKSGGAGVDGESSFQSAMDIKHFADRFGLLNRGNQSPILDMSEQASPAQLAAREEAIRDVYNRSLPPSGGHQMTRNASPLVRDVVDGLYSVPDASFLVGLLAGAPGAVVKGGLRKLGKEMAYDAGTDAALTGTLNYNLDPADRTAMQYVFGDGKSEEDRTPEAIADSQDARERMRAILDEERRQGNGMFFGTSAADRGLLERKIKERKVSPAPPMGW